MEGRGGGTYGEEFAQSIVWDSRHWQQGATSGRWSAVSEPRRRQTSSLITVIEFWTPQMDDGAGCYISATQTPPSPTATPTTTPPPPPPPPPPAFLIPPLPHPTSAPSCTAPDLDHYFSTIHPILHPLSPFLPSPTPHPHPLTHPSLTLLPPLPPSPLHHHHHQHQLRNTSRPDRISWWRLQTYGHSLSPHLLDESPSLHCLAHYNHDRCIIIGNLPHLDRPFLFHTLLCSR